MQYCRILAVSAILLCGTLTAFGENPSLRLNRIATLQASLKTSLETKLGAGLELSLETSQTVLVWSPDNTAAPVNSKVSIAAAILFSLLLFLAMGYTWQALDEEEFPDSELPHWFVSTFRGRSGGFLPRRD
jgi:hypothetical protein